MIKAYKKPKIAPIIADWARLNLICVKEEAIKPMIRQKIVDHTIVTIMRMIVFIKPLLSV